MVYRSGLHSITRMRGNSWQRLLRDHPLLVVAAYSRYGTLPGAEDKTCVAFTKHLEAPTRLRAMFNVDSRAWTVVNSISAVENQEGKEK
jgi:hypothetical protein